ncbi:MAG: DUF5050 domain-containing protein [Spirochaetales bacterium]|nr:DUF5050 domain-containing protein [Spirochaetales bacterium]
MKIYLSILLFLVCLFTACEEAAEIDFSEKTIFFGSYKDNGEIHAMTPEGAGQQTLITNGIYPRVSSNYEKIVYESFTDGDGEIWIANIDGSEAVQLTDNSFKDERPVFSPDGSVILFESDRSGNFDLYTMDLTGGSVTQITNAPEDEQRADYSPDGTKITYTVISNNSQIYVADSDGQNAVAVTASDFYWSWGSHWSPDGTTLAFTAWYGDNTDPFNGLYTIKADGTDLQELYTDSNGQEPCYSPDGDQLVFVGYENGQKQIFTINSDGSDVQQILSTTYECFQPFWHW